jgi:3-oxoadipate enol-lactonase
LTERRFADAQTFRCRDGGCLNYSIAGSGDPVVLIHGMGLDASMWDPQMPVLAREFRVIRYDLRGFGASTLPDGPYSHSDDLLGLLEFLGTPSAHIIGLSMGGRIALRFALEHPKAVRSLTLIDSALDGFAWCQEWRDQMNTIVHAARRGDIREARRLWLDHELFAPARSNSELAASLAAMVERYSGWHWANTDPVRLAGPPSALQLPSLAARTLVIVGDLDLPDFKEIAQRLSSGILHSTLCEIPGAGHMSNMEAPAAVNDRLLEHLRAAARA